MKKTILLLSAVVNTVLMAAQWDLRQSEIICCQNNAAVKEAAVELKFHLDLVTRSNIPLVDKATGKKFKFMVGAIPPGEKIPLKTAHYAVRGNTVYFWGISNKNLLNGPFNAVDFFLEHFLGIRWIKPGSNGIIFRETGKIILPEKRDFAWQFPKAWMINLRYGVWRQGTSFVLPEALVYPENIKRAKHEEERLWLARMHHGFQKSVRYGHAFIYWWSRFGKSHPEYFGLNPDGSRGIADNRGHYAHLCVSNPAVADQVVADWVKAGKPEYLNVCPNDGPENWCFCAGCRALDAHLPGEKFSTALADRELYFWNRIAERAVKHRKDVKLVAYIYSRYRIAPRREKVEYPDNIIFGVVPVMADDNSKLFGSWRLRGARHFFLRPNDTVDYVPYYRGQDKTIFTKLRQAEKFNLYGFDYDGTMGKRAADFEYYMLARATVFPELTFEEIENEFCSAYGNAAENVKQFLQFQRECEGKRRKLATADLQKDPATVKELIANSEYDSRINHNANNISSFFSIQDMIRGEEILKTGLKKELSTDEYRRLEDLLISQQNCRLTLEFNLVSLQNLPAAAKKLLAFRISNHLRLDMNWEYFMTKERLNWQRSGVWNFESKEYAPYKKEFFAGEKNVEVMPDGTAALTIKGNGKAWNTITLPIPFAVVKSRNFNFAGKFKMVNRSAGSIKIGIRQIDANGRTVGYVWSKPLTSSGDWENCHIPFTASEKTAKLQFYILAENLNEGAAGYVAGFSVVPDRYEKRFAIGEKNVKLLADGSAVLNMTGNEKSWQTIVLPVMLGNPRGRLITFNGRIKLENCTSGHVRVGIRQCSADGKTITYVWADSLDKDSDWLNFSKYFTAASNCGTLQFYLLAEKLNKEASVSISEFNVIPGRKVISDPVKKGELSAEELEGWR